MKSKIKILTILSSLTIIAMLGMMSLFSVPVSAFTGMGYDGGAGYGGGFDGTMTDAGIQGPCTGSCINYAMASKLIPYAVPFSTAGSNPYTAFAGMTGAGISSGMMGAPGMMGCHSGAGGGIYGGTYGPMYDREIRDYRSQSQFDDYRGQQDDREFRSDSDGSQQQNQKQRAQSNQNSGQ